MNIYLLFIVLCILEKIRVWMYKGAFTVMSHTDHMIISLVSKTCLVGRLCVCSARYVSNWFCINHG